jgi:hypothetical protein
MHKRLRFHGSQVRQNVATNDVATNDVTTIDVTIYGVATSGVSTNSLATRFIIVRAYVVYRIDILYRSFIGEGKKRGGNKYTKSTSVLSRMKHRHHEREFQIASNEI